MSDRPATDDVDSWIDRMNREFQEAARRWSGPTDPLSSLGGPDVDVVARDDSYLVAVNLPGYETDDVDVRLADDALTIDAERSESANVENESFVRRERSQTTVSRRLTFPEPVAREGVEASLEQGVLRVEVPKAEAERRGTEIDIG